MTVCTVRMVVRARQGCLGCSGSPTAQAQVKLEYKFPEGKKLTYKTTSRMRQVLTFMNNRKKESVMRETKVWTRSVGKLGLIQPCRSRRRSNSSETNTHSQTE